MSACCNQRKPVKEPEGSCPWPWVCSLESGAHGTIVHSFIYISQNRYLVSAQQVPSKEGNTESWTKLPSWSLCSNRENGLRTMPGCFYWLFLSSLKSVCKHLEGRVMLISSTMPNKVKTMILLDALLQWPEWRKSVKICMMKTWHYIS